MKWEPMNSARDGQEQPDPATAPSSVYLDIGDDKAVCFGGHWHGWLFTRHPDGQLVSVRKLDIAKTPHGDLSELSR